MRHRSSKRRSRNLNTKLMEEMMAKMEMMRMSSTMVREPQRQERTSI